MYYQFKDMKNVKLLSVTHLGDLYILSYVSPTHGMNVIIKSAEEARTLLYLEFLLEKGYANIAEIRFTAIA